MLVRCPQCGGDAPLPSSLPILRCPFCASSLVVDLSGAFLHKLLVPLLPERELRAKVGLPATTHGRLVHYPFWAWDRGAHAVMVPADALLAESLGEETALAGDERWFRNDEATAPPAHALPPNVPLAARLDKSEWTRARARLVHVPFFEWGEGAARAAVDAVEGRFVVRGTPLEASVLPLDLRLYAALVGLFFAAALLPSAKAVALALALVAAVAFFFVRGRLETGAR